MNPMVRHIIAYYRWGGKKVKNEKSRRGRKREVSKPRRGSAGPKKVGPSQQKKKTAIREEGQKRIDTNVKKYKRYIFPIGSREGAWGEAGRKRKGPVTDGAVKSKPLVGKTFNSAVGVAVHGGKTSKRSWIKQAMVFKGEGNASQD